MRISAHALCGAFALSLAACDGPREQAGEVADNASGAVKGEDSMTSGPAETMGERQDEAAESANQANEAAADALDRKAEAAEDEAKQKAEALRQEADKVRGQ
ncbi:MAG TPA: hypothetical protein VGB70_08010 [Allosphingosinicella sp.]|jgi:hypothetical protein